MDIELDPPHGITSFPLGMPVDELKSAAARLGRIEVTDEGSTAPFCPMKVVALHPQFEIVFHFERSKVLRAAEVWIPRPGPEQITVRFRGIDVFGTPALRLLEHLEGAGLSVRQIEPNHWVIPKLSLGFTRTAGHEVPLDADGDPLYFQAVLTGTTDYYDFLQ
ncbi:hypothetical protein ACIA8O_14185 [Kitasatospora sp. NPDC051853]|uniref:hypothetical protein n=1 Tax=Kitasatospora sp. NPDC051853 TaxID=3364058 RepID=UPI0037BD0A93